jgi:hypothetical protein
LGTIGNFAHQFAYLKKQKKEDRIKTVSGNYDMITLKRICNCGKEGCYVILEEEIKFFLIYTPFYNF